MVSGAKTIAQYKILHWIDQNFTKVKIELQGADRVRITDSREDFLEITINSQGDIVDAISGEILSRKGAIA